jgi:hypothetical protein
MTADLRRLSAPGRSANQRKATNSRMGPRRRLPGRIPTTDLLTMQSKIARIQTRLPLGHTIGIVRRPISLSPTSSRKSWAWIVEKIMRSLTANDIKVRVVIVDWPSAGRTVISKYGVKGVIRTSYCGSPRVERSIAPCVAGVAHEPMRVEVQFVVYYEGYCKGDTLPMCF